MLVLFQVALQEVGRHDNQVMLSDKAKQFSVINHRQTGDLPSLQR